MFLSLGLGGPEGLAETLSRRGRKRGVEEAKAVSSQPPERPPVNRKAWWLTVGGSGGVRPEPSGPEQPGAQSFLAEAADSERWSGLCQVTQQERRTGPEPRLPLLLLPVSWGSGAGSHACVAHRGSEGAG